MGIGGLQAHRCWTAEGPIGPRCIAFLRRVRAAGVHYTIMNNADRAVLDKALSAGFVARVGKSREDVRLTAAGAAFLDRLARVE
ncbi:hypothetical protein [Ensifer sp. LCM 4579]|uniref:hypothetical protein n=1 Tax=Ensifer sp. LCM 4579 TaxID=1848292 RepID=UPI0008DA9BC9|nr:hypothetical protein [Ensifer sp. LCM 4579]OHV85935.1 hypothetical protein LCM4579_00810 [Ensifer sp. LCM 4579]